MFVSATAFIMSPEAAKAWINKFKPTHSRNELCIQKLAMLSVLF